MEIDENHFYIKCHASITNSSKTQIYHKHYVLITENTLTSPVKVVLRRQKTSSLISVEEDSVKHLTLTPTLKLLDDVINVIVEIIAEIIADYPGMRSL